MGRNLGVTFEPQLAAARSLQQATRDVRPYVLITDDDEFQQKMLARILSNEPIDLAFAGTANEALALLRRERPDLVLMDINLPGVNGIEATMRIKSLESFASIPIIMVTGDSKKQSIVDNLRAGASGFLVKPIGRDNLLAQLEKHFGKLPSKQ